MQSEFKVMVIHLSGKQECIPVGCVPSAAVAVSGGDVHGPGGCAWSGGWCVCVVRGRG